VALRKLMRQVYALAEDAPLPEYLAVAATWAPYRTVASWYLYAWIHRRRAEARNSKGSMPETLV